MPSYLSSSGRALWCFCVAPGWAWSTSHFDLHDSYMQRLWICMKSPLVWFGLLTRIPSADTCNDTHKRNAAGCQPLWRAGPEYPLTKKVRSWGIEPQSVPWQGTIIPLYYERWVMMSRSCSNWHSARDTVLGSFYAAPMNQNEPKTNCPNEQKTVPMNQKLKLLVDGFLIYAKFFACTACCHPAVWGWENGDLYRRQKKSNVLLTRARSYCPLL